MCWVIPPASSSMVLVSRMASSSEVLPWSTCPITVTTGARGRRSPLAASTGARSWAVCSSKEITCVLALNCVATSPASWVSSDWLMVASIPRSIRTLITSFARTSSFSASSLTVMPSVTVMWMGSRRTGTTSFPLGLGIFRSPGSGRTRGRTGCITLRSPSSNLRSRWVRGA